MLQTPFNDLFFCDCLSQFLEIVNVGAVPKEVATIVLPIAIITPFEIDTSLIAGHAILYPFLRLGSGPING